MTKYSEHSTGRGALGKFRKRKTHRVVLNSLQNTSINNHTHSNTHTNSLRQPKYQNSKEPWRSAVIQTRTRLCHSNRKTETQVQPQNHDRGGLTWVQALTKSSGFHMLDYSRPHQQKNKMPIFLPILSCTYTLCCTLYTSAGSTLACDFNFFVLRRGVFRHFSIHFGAVGAFKVVFDPRGFREPPGNVRQGIHGWRRRQR